MDEAHPTVLLVEDNDLVRGMVMAMLATHGFAVVAAETAEQGIVEFESNPAVSFAILDMILPGKSGLDLAAELERRRPGFRILYMSGLGDSIAMESIARRAPDMVLIKPFSEELLLQRVDALLGNASVAPAYSASLSTMSRPVFPWDRLVEASDELGNAGASVISYLDTAAGFAIAITHVAVLRAAGVPYTFRFTGNTAMPLMLAVLPDDLAQAQSLIEHIGLGADIAPAA
ncbi:MAG: response regulator [Candidatus Sulfopaludibacter sp.]|nr:response regulator [Candidatus Sulfopaludibacter sp.]